MLERQLFPRALVCPFHYTVLLLSMVMGPLLSEIVAVQHDLEVQRDKGDLLSESTSGDANESLLRFSIALCASGPTEFELVEAWKT